MQKDKIKILIISLFYKNYNYGGLLQAYSLIKFLNSHGYDAKQIKYLQHKSPTKADNPYSYAKRIFSNNNTINSLKKLKSAVRDKTRLKILSSAGKFSKEFNKINIKVNKYKSFAQENIPSTNNVYYTDTIDKCNDADIFIAGSDQIWRLYNWDFDYGFSLDFAPSHTKKITYAASPPLDYIDKNLYSKIQQRLKSNTSLSVRESSGLDILKKILTYKTNDSKLHNLANSAQVVLDPVFLLSKDDWTKQFNLKNKYDFEYVFAYMLGFNNEQRHFITKFCKDNKLKLITIPFLLNRYNFHDKKFGDILFPDAGPIDFLSLLYNAKYVFTDSFHATIFSIIFNKEFFVFKINRNYSFSRIYDILKICSCKNRLIDCSKNQTKEENINMTKQKLDYEKINKIISKEKDKSIKFLLSSISAD